MVLQSDKVIRRKRSTYVTVNSNVCPGAVDVLTNVSSMDTVMGTVIVAVAEGVTVLKMVINPEESEVVFAGGAPPDGSTTIVPGRLEMGIVIWPVPAVTVMISPEDVGVTVLLGRAVMVAELLEVPVIVALTMSVVDAVVVAVAVADTDASSVVALSVEIAAVLVVLIGGIEVVDSVAEVVVSPDAVDRETNVSLEVVVATMVADAVSVDAIPLTVFDSVMFVFPVLFVSGKSSRERG